MIINCDVIFSSTQSSDEGGGACGSGHSSFISSVVQLTEHERLVLEVKRMFNYFYLYDCS